MIDVCRVSGKIACSFSMRLWNAPVIVCFTKVFISCHARPPHNTKMPQNRQLGSMSRAYRPLCVHLHPLNTSRQTGTNVSWTDSTRTESPPTPGRHVGSSPVRGNAHSTGSQGVRQSCRSSKWRWPACTSPINQSTAGGRAGGGGRSAVDESGKAPGRST